MAIVTYSEIKVGLLVILVIALLLALTLSIGNFQELFSDTITISITIPSVVGLEPHSQVTYSGVRIGTVTNIRFDEGLDKAVIEANIDYDSPVSIDSKVTFTAAGLLSPFFIEISGGSKNKRIRDLLLRGEIEPRDVILEAEPYLSIGEIFAVAGDVKNVLNQVEDVLVTLNEPLSGITAFVDDVSREVNVILTEVEGMVVESRPRVRTALDHADHFVVSASGEVVPALRDIRQGAGDIPGLVADTRKQMDQVMGKAGGLIDTVSPEVTEISGEVITLLQELQGRVETVQKSVVTLMKDVDSVVVSNREEIDRITQHLEQTAANLNTISTELAKNPWRLLWKTEGKKTPVRVSPDWNPIEMSAPSR